MPRSADQLAEAIVASGVLPPEALTSFWTTPPSERPKDGPTLTKLLVDQGLLTNFQAIELVSGSGVPLVIGDYVLLTKIGAGGMGQVFKAKHRHMDRVVAIKLMSSNVTMAGEGEKRFQREVKAAARLSHPNIVVALDARYERGVWCLVMEYVEGRDLGALVREHGPLPVDRAADCILQAARCWNCRISRRSICISTLGSPTRGSWACLGSRS